VFILDLILYFSSLKVYTFSFTIITITYNINRLMAGKIKIDTERCKGCGLCVIACPNKAIVISKKPNKKGYFPAEKTDIECTGCAACAIICPDATIEVYRDESIISAEDKAEPKITLAGEPK